MTGLKEKRKEAGARASHKMCTKSRRERNVCCKDDQKDDEGKKRKQRSHDMTFKRCQSEGGKKLSPLGLGLGSRPNVFDNFQHQRQRLLHQETSEHEAIGHGSIATRANSQQREKVHSWRGRSSQKQQPESLCLCLSSLLLNASGEWRWWCSRHPDQ